MKQLLRQPLLIGDIIVIPLTQGQFAIIDKEDGGKLSGCNFCLSGGKYAATWKDGEMILMHRMLVECPKGFVVDHADRNGLNNRKSNLRICRHRENICNRKKTSGKKSSRYHGVTFCKQTGRWRAQIMVNGQNTPLGRFSCEKEAARAYDQASLKFHKEFGVRNFKGL